MRIKKKFAVGFITYRPENSFFNRLDLLTNDGLGVYVFDNTPDLEWKNAPTPCIKYITAGKNVGLGIGLSILCSTSFYDGYRYLLFFDQDTGFSKETINYIGDFIEAHDESIIAENAAVVFESSVANSKNRFDIRKVDLAISSGSLFVLRNMQKIGWHNEKYFVDGVDYEFCLRARHASLGITKCTNTPGFDHVSEQPDKIFVLWGKTFLLRIYSLARIRDTLGSYIKLMFAALSKFDLKMVYLFARSMAIYCSGQVVSRVVLRKF